MEKAASNQSLPSKISSTNPPWLLPGLADVDERMKKLLTISASEEEKAGETFAERAEWYYQKRPQLLSLLKDLYKGYIILLNTKLKHPPQKNASECSTFDEEDQYESDIESTLSFQQPAAQSWTNIDNIVAELVVKNVENEMLQNQVNEMEQVGNESGKKIDLLKKLLELLESERVILMNEKVKLEYKVDSLEEDKRSLASEAMFMKRKACELARIVLRMREDHRVCILSQKIEDLQEQIYGLEKRNKEYYNMLLSNREHQQEEKEMMNRSKSSKVKSHKLVTLEGSFQSPDKLKLNKSNSALWKSDSVKGAGEKKGSKWWEKVKNVDLFSCGLNPSCT
ncbi:kinase-interacting family protein-like [Mangifera indica]|uniref:kinase-interacting family protein-like n=1 Tax=Mangifera indica TaxID=29780 RepID=UPI001CFA4C94|nr:kinase-interacting family protein-like [Mangifera indica]